MKQEADPKAVLDALDFEPRCEIVLTYTSREFRRKQAEGDRCEKPAQWRIRCRWCSMHGLLCDEHATQLARSDRAKCMRCKEKGTPAEVFEVSPLPTFQAG